MEIPKGDDIFEIANCGMGCVLIEREVVALVESEFSKPCEARMVTYYYAQNEWIRDERMNPSSITD